MGETDLSFEIPKKIVHLQPWTTLTIVNVHLKHGKLFSDIAPASLKIECQGTEIFALDLVDLSKGNVNKNIVEFSNKVIINKSSSGKQIDLISLTKSEDYEFHVGYFLEPIDFEKIKKQLLGIWYLESSSVGIKDQILGFSEKEYTLKQGPDIDLKGEYRIEKNGHDIDITFVAGNFFRVLRYMSGDKMTLSDVGNKDWERYNYVHHKPHIQR
jgi:hypothetical protein